MIIYYLGEIHNIIRALCRKYTPIHHLAMTGLPWQLRWMLLPDMLRIITDAKTALGSLSSHVSCGAAATHLLVHIYRRPAFLLRCSRSSNSVTLAYQTSSIIWDVWEPQVVTMWDESWSIVIMTEETQLSTCTSAYAIPSVLSQHGRKIFSVRSVTVVSI